MPELTLERVLKSALNMEEQSIKIYTSAQNRVSSPSSKVLLKELVKEERRRRTDVTGRRARGGGPTLSAESSEKNPAASARPS